MKRREFLRNISLAGLGTLLVPGALTGCRRDDTLFNGKSFSGKVIVIGGGVAGMYAAYLLHQQNINFKLLEAGPTLGGRIRRTTGFGTSEYDLGGNMVRGEKSIIFDLLQSRGKLSRPASLQDYLFIDSQLKAEGDWAEDPDLRDVQDTIRDFPVNVWDDVTVEQVVTDRLLSNRTRHVLDSRISNRRGSSSNRLGIKPSGAETALWTAGGIDYYPSESILSSLETIFSAITPKVILNSSVTRIDTDGDGVKVTNALGDVDRADYVICTVPLSILNAGTIVFNPPLPENKTTALTKVRMDAAVRVLLRFSGPFWATDTEYILGNMYWPEFRIVHGKSGSDYVIAATAFGANADYLSAQGANAINIALNELDVMYGSGSASARYLNGQLMDWSIEHNILGGISYTLPGAGDARKHLAEPIAGKLYFAGEAVNTNGHAGTIHGAMETAYTAVYQILDKVV